ncbi:MAG: hypothetical protein ABSG57_08065 [Candidatus Bathyarchaeia archaeon]
MSEINISDVHIELPKGKSLDRLHMLRRFSDNVQALGDRIGFAVSARGWGYQLAGFGLITKDDIDLAERLIHEAEDLGYIPCDFLAKDESRAFSCVEIPHDITPVQYLGRLLSLAQNAEKYYVPDWWEGERFYIQCIVEKIDLKTLWLPTSSRFHVPIATTKGWSSKFQRDEYGRRFKEAEEKGLECVLMVGTDHDPPGVYQYDNLRKNLEDVQHHVWSDGTHGYDPRDLIIERFALTHVQIENLALPWINNLITSSGQDLGNPNHAHFHLPYVQNYIKAFGRRKVELNALLMNPVEAQKIYEDALLYGGEHWNGLGESVLSQFDAKRSEVVNEIQSFRRENGIDDTIESVLAKIRGEHR